MPGAEVSDAGQVQPIGESELRLLQLRRRIFGYARSDVDEALERAAHTIGDLLRRVEGHGGELAAMADKLAGLEAELGRGVLEKPAEAPRPAGAELAVHPRPEAAQLESEVGKVLARAHGVAERHLRKAREDASEIVTAAHVRAAAILAETDGDRDRLERLLHTAEQEIENARFYAKSLLEIGKSDHDRAVEAALAEAEGRVADLRGESAGLEARIEELRRDAPRQPPETPAEAPVAPTAEEGLAAPREGLEPAGGEPGRHADVASDLHARLVDNPER